MRSAAQAVLQGRCCSRAGALMLPCAGASCVCLICVALYCVIVELGPRMLCLGLAEPLMAAVRPVEWGVNHPESNRI